MANDSLLNKVLSISPHLELLIKNLYWRNIRFISKISLLLKHNKSKKPLLTPAPLDFDKLRQHLISLGVKKGSVLLLHSSYDSLHGRGKKPDEIVNFLLELIGENGTLAMPAMPIFKNAISKVDYLDSKSHASQVFEYDIKKSGIKTGLLPLVLHRTKGSVRSAHPVNTMVACGKYAEFLMEDNIGSLPCGQDSAWYKCIKLDAIIVSLGVDMASTVTSIHATEDVRCDSWPVTDWYHMKNFVVKDGKDKMHVTLKERKPKWGALHFAERKLCKDLLANNLLSTDRVDGLLVESISSRELHEFVINHANNTYPYYWLKK